MKTIIIALAALLSASAFATVNLKLGSLVSIAGDDVSNFKIEAVLASVGASSDVSPTITWKGCYAKKVDTGQSFPYRYNYVPQSVSKEIPFEVEGKTIALENFEALRKAAKKELKQELRFYCKKSTTVSVVVKIVLENGENATASFSIDKDKRGYYIQKPYGKAYLDKGAIDFVHTPGLDDLF